MSTSPAAWIQDRVERNLANANNPDRVQNINEIDVTPGRVIEQKLLTIVSRYPNQVGRAIGIELPEDGEFAGASSNWTWLRSQETGIVKKVHKGSRRMAHADRDALAQSLTAEHEMMANYIGPHFLRQTVRNADHPFRPGKRAVFFEHPDPRIVDLGLFHSQKPELIPGRVDRAETAFPGISNELYDFSQRAIALQEEQHLLADTSAMHSLGLIAVNGWPEVRLTFQHGAPIPDPKPRDLDRVMGQLSELAAATA